MNGPIASVVGVVVLGLGLSAAPVSAQEAGDKGVTIAAPSSIGFIWHLSPRVAMRPEVSFGLSETDGDGGATPDLRSNSVTVAASALFYVGQWDSLRAYLTPKVSYSRSSTSFQSGVSQLDSTANAWAAAGAFGAQYSLGRRFAVFGEAGAQYSSSRSESPSLFSSVDRTTWTFGTRTEIGVAFYF